MPMTDAQSDPHDAPAEPIATPPLDLRVAEVLEAGAHPNADRLLVLRIDLGSERRQLVAGLAGIYDPDALVGKRIVVVANLKPATLRGEVSQGMLLAAHGEEQVGLLLAPDAGPGTPLETEAEPEAGTVGTTPAPTATEAGAPQITIDDFAAHTIIATPDAVTVDGRRVRAPKLTVDRDAWGKVR